MRVLADTSVWVQYLRGRAGRWRAPFESMIEAENVLICGPVLAELAKGTRSADEQAELRLALSAIPWAPLDRVHWWRVGEAAAELRRRGLSMALTDVEIAVASAEAGAILWTLDADFRTLVKFVPGLQTHAPRA